MVVSNTSPIINLAFAGLLELLPKLYGEVTIPEAVWQESVVGGEGQPGAAELQQATWVRVRRANNRELVLALRQELDEVEEEAIVVAWRSKLKFC